MTAPAPDSLTHETPAGKLRLNEDGSIAQLAFAEAGRWNEIRFRQDEFRGPAWFIEQGDAVRKVELRPTREGRGPFQGESEGLHFRLEYQLGQGGLVVRATLDNPGPGEFAPSRCGLKLGLDTYMVSPSDWDQLYFPTLLRCEESHFWGYGMSPLGRILGIASLDPVASWCLDYNSTLYGTTWHGGHRIYTINLDLLNTLPLPRRHPQHLNRLPPGNSRTWTIYLTPIPTLEKVKPILAQLSAAPMIQCERHTLAAGETARVQVFSSQDSTLILTGPDGTASALPVDSGGDDRRDYAFSLADTPGVYTLTAANPTGKKSEAKLYVRRPWSWYLRQARREALAKPQKASTHMESWLGFYSAFLARKHFPDPALDREAEALFREQLPLMVDPEKGEPVLETGRIQNTACMVGLLTDLYEVAGKTEDLDLAARLADWLVQSQDHAGAYRASTAYSPGVHYTSVAHMAKYMLELSEAERPLGAASPLWQTRYERHYQSARKAVDDLERLRDRIGTEGEHTFEDGMISCTALQLALFALLQADPLERQRYATAARQVLHKHRCLEQILIPDCRMNGATLRFWEAQYDVLIKHDLLSSPHGWTSWKTYATWYLYLLSGEEELLRQTMDTLGACMQVVDLERGELRWGFACDPYIPARVFRPDPAHPGQGQFQETVLGEQYVEMISGWWQAPKGKSTGGYWDQGGCCDNDVHEHFKCLEEVALCSAYVVERENGQLISWNCSSRIEAGTLQVHPLEDVVSAVHFNLITKRPVEVHFGREVARGGLGPETMFWVRQGGTGNLHRP